MFKEVSKAKRLPDLSFSKSMPNYVEASQRNGLKDIFTCAPNKEIKITPI